MRILPQKPLKSAQQFCSIAVVLLEVTVLLAQPSSVKSELKLYSESAELMGVKFSIALYASSEKVAKDACRQAFLRISEIESKLSNYQADSEITLLCQTEGAVNVSDDLWFVLKESLTYWRMSEGAFDVAIGRLTRLWRRARRQQELPERARIRKELRFVGSHLLALDHDAQTVEILKPGMLIDLGAIGKGFAADEALKVLRNHGLGSAVINASGDVLFGDPPPGKDGWPAAIGSFPPSPEPTYLRPLSNVALATSGDAFQFLEYDGTRYSHIVDPRTGIPLKGRSSVSVIAASGLQSDALASAVSVLGARKGVALIKELVKTEVYMAYQRSSGKPVEIYSTIGFPLKSKE